MCRFHCVILLYKNWIIVILVYTQYEVRPIVLYAELLYTISVVQKVLYKKVLYKKVLYKKMLYKKCYT